MSPAARCSIERPHPIDHHQRYSAPAVKPHSNRSPKPKTFDACLAAVPVDKRAALEKLRRAIRSAAPAAEECVSYGLPAFRLGGKFFVAIGAAANHCAFYLGSTIAVHAVDLAKYDTSKGAIRFPASDPLPASLIRKLVKSRLAQNARLTEQRTLARRGKKSPAELPAVGARTDPAVGELLAKLDHPLQREFAAVRRIVLGASPDIREGVKWNAPSFRTTDWFATVNLRSTDQVQLVLHLGAKAKKLPPSGLPLADPTGLIKWLARDRCLLTLGAGRAFAARRTAFVAIIRAWIRFL
jgi:uncharacterized protein YdhG (YjbR/CyaY superfamily)